MAATPSFELAINFHSHLSSDSSGNGAKQLTRNILDALEYTIYSIPPTRAVRSVSRFIDMMTFADGDCEGRSRSKRCKDIDDDE